MPWQGSFSHYCWAILLPNYKTLFQQTGEQGSVILGGLSLGDFILIQWLFFFILPFLYMQKRLQFLMSTSVWFCRSVGLCCISCVDFFYSWELMESDVHHKPEIKEFNSSDLERLIPAQNEVLLPCCLFSRSCKADMLVFIRDKMLLTSMNRSTFSCKQRVSSTNLLQSLQSVWPSVALQLSCP